ncbi:hypothetical protein Cpin_1688 [Chitinophaga pinensis DSM 2588]|uniref:Uncharacterized protein n=1 Tax=Chitinophaga pinensis (strain ATCC 43595 / DSM 2588 / LMG 13176 / NBRC 15968 / NCIMB 11800 / UQM 2034) TaxID=485918 RepID=A0A979G1L4_CHIPD|nr:hypothetical protein Cpin_1688 [Chitinophaga pinensis DSM 2588]
MWNDFFSFQVKKTLRAFLIIALLFLFTQTKAQQNNINSIKASYDPDAIAELYDRIPLGLVFRYENGQTRKTEGYLQGVYRWKNIKISSSNGSVQNGYLLVNRQQLASQQFIVELTISVPESATPITTKLELPHLTGIRFNHYADSLKRGFRFYLNVEGTFTSGKVYPLDTATIKFETDAGKLLGQDLLLNSNDGTTRSITVTAVNKNDPGMSVSSTIPVKQLSDQ